VGSDGTTIASTLSYDPWGKVTETGSGAKSDFTYTGHHFDRATGLNLAQYRGYDPNLGRWISRDPIGLAGGVNVYGYVNNNPLRWRDPNGLTPESVLDNPDNDPGWNDGVHTSGTVALWGMAIGLAVFETVAAAPAALAALRSALLPAAGGANALKDRVNPGGFQNNCGSAAIALDRTLAGAPASAIDTGPLYMSEVAQVYGNRGMASYPSLASIADFMARAGPGARGIVYGGRANGELAHFFNVVNNNGNVVFIDGSTGQIANTLGFTFFHMMRTN